MAELTTNTETIVKITSFNLILSLEELTFLQCLLWNTGGDPKHSYRKYEKQITDAIDKFADKDLRKKMTSKLTKSFHFEDGF